MTNHGAGSTAGGDTPLNPTDGPFWSDEHGVRWRKRSGIYGKRLRKLLANTDVRVLHWSNTTCDLRDVPIDERERLRHSVERSLHESDWRECQPGFYAYDFKGPNHETLVIISAHHYDLPE